MTSGLAIALTLMTGCYADRMLAPARIASPIHVREIKPLQPPYVVEVDGVRSDSLQLAQLNAGDIETITVVKGPPAASLYAPHPCPAVVVVITTKHAARPGQH